MTLAPDDPRVEILAMNLWLKTFGVNSLNQAWIDWARRNPRQANALRAQADEMIFAATKQAGHNARNTDPKTSHHHSLGWLL